MPYLLSYLPGLKGYFVLVIWNIFKFWVEFQALQSNVSEPLSCTAVFRNVYRTPTHTPALLLHGRQGWIQHGSYTWIANSLVGHGLGTRVSCRAKYSDVRDIEWRRGWLFTFGAFYGRRDTEVGELTGSDLVGKKASPGRGGTLQTWEVEQRSGETCEQGTHRPVHQGLRGLLPYVQQQATQV